MEIPPKVKTYFKIHNKKTFGKVKIKVKYLFIFKHF